MMRSNTLGTRSRTLRWSAVVVSMIVASMSVMTNPLPAQKLTWLGGNFSDTEWWTLAYLGISDNGATVAARYWNGSFGRGYIWRVGQQGMRELAPLSGYSHSGVAKAISADGSKVYYDEWGNSGERSLRWEPTGPQGETITPLSGAGSFYVHSCTPDGRYLAGGGRPAMVDVTGNNDTGLRWNLNLPQGFVGGYGLAITETGSNSWVVVGHVRDNNRVYPAIWRVSGVGSPGTLEQITALNNNGLLWGVSADGTKACGFTYDSDVIDAILWQEGSGSILTLPDYGYRAGAFHMTADGNTIVGLATDSGGNRYAVRWTASGNTYTIEDLNQTYASLLWPGSVLHSASAISRDGRFIAGIGYNAWTRRVEAYLLDTRPCDLPDVTGDGFVDDADLLEVLFNFGSSCGN